MCLCERASRALKIRWIVCPWKYQSVQRHVTVPANRNPNGTNTKYHYANYSEYSPTVINCSIPHVCISLDGEKVIIIWQGLCIIYILVKLFHVDFPVFLCDSSLYQLQYISHFFCLPGECHICSLRFGHHTPSAVQCKWIFRESLWM